jgi:hypothetical protein
MNVQEKIDIFMKYIRATKRKVFSTALAASIICVLLFVAGSYWLLYTYFERIVKDYYSSVLRNISAFQYELIGKESYIEDLKDIAMAVVRYKGVEHVWFTDRFGRLIYSTDSGVFKQYRKRRLPSDYYESIEWVWSFEEGYPKAHIVPINRFFSLRYSIPLYANSRDEYDFIMGMDVKRFIYLPQKLSLLLPVSIGYVGFFIILLFFPIFFWVNSRFSGIIIQAKTLFGSMEFDRGRTVAPEYPGSQGEPQTEGETQAPPEPAAPLEPEEETEEGAPEETQAPRETKSPEEISARVKPKEKIKAKTSEETKAPEEIKAPEEMQSPVEKEQEADSLALFYEKSKDIFMKEDIELPFIHASSFVHHSQKLEGSYVYTHRGKNAIYFASFIFPYKEASEALAHTDAMITFMQKKMDDGARLRELSRELNGFCLDNSIELDLSIVSIYEEERTVQYGSYGSGYSLYIKHDEERVKELALRLPRLGTVSKDKVKEIFSFSDADIKFITDDIFILLPQNAAEVDLDGTNFVDTVKKDIPARKGQGVREITEYFSKSFKGKLDIPQTGFVVFKFI